MKTDLFSVKHQYGYVKHHSGGPWNGMKFKYNIDEDTEIMDYIPLSDKIYGIVANEFMFVQFGTFRTHVEITLLTVKHTYPTPPWDIDYGPGYMIPTVMASDVLK